MRAQLVALRADGVNVVIQCGCVGTATLTTDPGADTEGVRTMKYVEERIPREHIPTHFFRLLGRATSESWAEFEWDLAGD